MGILSSAAKGAAAAAPIAMMYSAAGNPAGGLLAMGVGAGVGATAGAAHHPALNKYQFKSPANPSASEMENVTKWRNEIGK